MTNPKPPSPSATSPTAAAPKPATASKDTATPAKAPAPTPVGTRPTAGKGAGLTALGGAVGAAKPAAAASNEGPLTRRTIELVQESWGKVMPISDAAAALFYDRLFELDPSVRPMFKDDMTEQKKKLMQTLSVAVDGLN